MSIAETYQISPDWGSLADPLISRIEMPNGISDSVLERLHEIGLEKFRTAQYPNRKNEDWKYTPVRQIVNLPLVSPQETATDPGKIEDLKGALDAYSVVLINGRYEPNLSDKLPNGIILSALSELASNDNLFPKVGHFTELLAKGQMTPFEALVSASIPAGLCIHIDSNVNIEKPIHLIHLALPDAKNPIYLTPYKLIHASRNSEVSIVESFVGSGTGISVTNSVNHVFVESGAHLRHYRLQDEDRGSFHINATRVFQEADSEYTSFAAELGSKLARNNIETIHLGSGITSNLYGTFIGRDRQHLDTQSFIDHAMPNCNSNELYKGVLMDHARGVFNGKILVRQDAQKTNAFQQNSTLVLSPDAIMDSKPQLEIFADDVRCSHGATIGQLDEDSVFYLRSRGLNRNEASAMLQHAFIGEVLDKFPDDHIKSYFSKRVESAHHA